MYTEIVVERHVIRRVPVARQPYELLVKAVTDSISLPHGLYAIRNSQRTIHKVALEVHHYKRALAAAMRK
jgi:hypothetical protein